MRYRVLGSTGLKVSEIGFGAWGIGGNASGAVAYGPTDDTESLRALSAAYERGINFFDTADLYGFGHSEALLGQALRSMTRERVVIATKAGMTDASGAQDFSERHLREALEGSLRRLATDYVDLFQLHGPSIALLRRDESLRALLDDLRKEGKIRHYGISARSPEEALAAVTDLGFGCVQVNFNLVDQRALENGLFEVCARRGVGVIVRTPLCFGFLTGKVDATSRFDASDHRARWSEAQRKRWADAVRMFVGALGGRLAQSPAQVALRFCLSFPAVSTAIPGMLSVREVEENAAAGSEGALIDEDRRALVQVYRSGDFFVRQ